MVRMCGWNGTAVAWPKARTVGALGNVVQDRAGSVAHLVGLELRSEATRVSGVLSPKLSIRSDRLASRRLPLPLALALCGLGADLGQERRDAGKKLLGKVRGERLRSSRSGGRGDRRALMPREDSQDGCGG